MKLNAISREIYSFIKELQHSNEDRKKKWFVGGAVVIMAAVLFLWALYMSVALPELQKEDVVENNRVNKGSFLETFRRGFEEVAGEVGEKSNLIRSEIDGGLKAIAEETTQFEVSVREPNIFFKILEPVPEGEFPKLK